MSKKKHKKLQKDTNLTPVVTEVVSPEKEEINQLIQHLYKTQTYSDVVNCFNLMSVTSEKFKDAISKGLLTSKDVSKTFSMVGLGDVFGYRPGGVQLFNLFPNPFGVFTYIAENFGPVKVCRDIIRTEVYDDGFFLEGDSSPEVIRRIEQFNIYDLILDILDNADVVGNVWIKKPKSILGGIKNLELVLPHTVSPLLSKDKESVVGWQITNGFSQKIYTKNDLLHFKYKSLRHKDLGIPPMSSILVNIEAGMKAEQLNLNVFDKMGLVGLVFLVENLDRQGSGIGESSFSRKFARELQDELNSNASGVSSAFGSLALAGVKDVKKVGELSTLDGAFHKTSDLVRADVSRVWGVPVERLSMVRSDSQQYHAARLEDTANSNFDKTVRRRVDSVLYFANKEIMPLIGLPNTKIRAKGRHSATTRVGTQAGGDLSNIFIGDVGVMTVDEYRTQILKIGPHPDASIGVKYISYKEKTQPPQQ